MSHPNVNASQKQKLPEIPLGLDIHQAYLQLDATVHELERSLTIIRNLMARIGALDKQMNKEKR